jgi:hypothetical protein
MLARTTYIVIASRGSEPLGCSSFLRSESIRDSSLLERYGLRALAERSRFDGRPP